jgi:hypothetical protein
MQGVPAQNALGRPRKAGLFCFDEMGRDDPVRQGPIGTVALSRAALEWVRELILHGAYDASTASAAQREANFRANNVETSPAKSGTRRDARRSLLRGRVTRLAFRALAK